MVDLSTPCALSLLTARHLASNVKPCLALCNEHLFHPPSDDDWGSCFRSKAFSHVAEDVLPESCHTEFTEATIHSFDRFREVRTSLLESDGRINSIDDTTTTSEIHRPRSLLLTDWSKSLFDGAVTPETNGFINEDCIAPWDTWIALVVVDNAYGPCCLLSWIPGWSLHQVE